MDRAKIKKATPIAVTLVIALTPQLLAFCDNRAKAYEARKAAKEARLEAVVSRDKANAGYETLLPAIQELQKHRAEDQAFMLAESQRVTELTEQVEALRLMVPARRRPEALKAQPKPPVAMKPRAKPPIELPENLDEALQQVQRTTADELRLKRGN
jgi:hypothetical protein